MLISRKKFLIITLLFALVPFSTHWKLFLFGKKATGIVVQHKISSPLLNRTDKFSLIEYETQKGEKILIYGPEEVEYPIGKEIGILYMESKPEKYVMLNGAGLLLTNKVILPLVALIMWIAFYLSFGQQTKSKPKKDPFLIYKKYLEEKTK